MKGVLEVLRRDHLKLGVELQPGASRDIMDFENRMNIRLPRDFKWLYQLCDGYSMLEESMFNLIPLAEILENTFDRKDKGDDFLASLGDFHF